MLSIYKHTHTHKYLIYISMMSTNTCNGFAFSWAPPTAHRHPSHFHSWGVVGRAWSAHFLGSSRTSRWGSCCKSVPQIQLRRCQMAVLNGSNESSAVGHLFALVGSKYRHISKVQKAQWINGVPLIIIWQGIHLVDMIKKTECVANHP